MKKYLNLIFFVTLFICVGIYACVEFIDTIAYIDYLDKSNTFLGITYETFGIKISILWTMIPRLIILIVMSIFLGYKSVKAIKALTKERKNTWY